MLKPEVADHHNLLEPLRCYILADEQFGVAARLRAVTAALLLRLSGIFVRLTTEENGIPRSALFCTNLLKCGWVTLRRWLGTALIR